jgi:predicted anti-sigma-YlaC factor YlaD
LQERDTDQLGALKMFGLIFLLIDLTILGIKITIHLMIWMVRLFIALLPFMIAGAIALFALLVAAAAGLAKLTVWAIETISEVVEARRRAALASQSAEGIRMTATPRSGN